MYFAEVIVTKMEYSNIVLYVEDTQHKLSNLTNDSYKIIHQSYGINI